MTSKANLPVREKPPSFTDPFNGSNDYDYDYADNDISDYSDLPHPEPLPRSDFLASNFEPAAYLSSLPHRHQTLEDLRSDLRDRSAAISKELIDLVNANYTAFLSLGDELRGGDEKVEDVRVALLGFRRAVDDTKSRVAERRGEASKLTGELKGVRSTIEEGRQMIELSERLSALEERLSPEGAVDDNEEKTSDTEDSEPDEEEENDDTDFRGSSPTKLRNLARQCAQAVAMAEQLDQEHPFVLKLEERLERCRNTLLLDLGIALKEARKAGLQGQDRVLKYLSIYRLIDAQDAAVKVLKNG